MGKFIGLLRGHGINVLIDVRSSPQSRYSPHFDRASLCESLREAGIAYVYHGEALGGRPADASLWEEGQPSWELIAASASFKQGIVDLVRNVPRWTLGLSALMCSEENPECCHRRGLVTPTLVAAGFDVQHIRGDGRLESEAAVAERTGEGRDLLALLNDA